MNAASILKEVPRRIRYRTLPYLIGRNIKISRLDTIATDILQTLENLLPDECELDSSINPRVIAKYGILDLRFTVPDTVLKTNHRSGISMLGELGFFPPPEEILELEVSEIADPRDISLAQDLWFGRISAKT